MICSNKGSSIGLRGGRNSPHICNSTKTGHLKWNMRHSGANMPQGFLVTNNWHVKNYCGHLDSACDFGPSEVCLTTVPANGFHPSQQPHHRHVFFWAGTRLDTYGNRTPCRHDETAPALSILSGGLNAPTNQPQPAIPAALAQPCWLLIPQVVLGILRFVCSWIHIGKCIMAWVAELLDMVFPPNVKTTYHPIIFELELITKWKTWAHWRVSFRRLGVGFMRSMKHRWC